MLGQIFDTLLGVLLLFAVLGIVNSVLVEAFPRVTSLFLKRQTRGSLLRLAIGNMLGEWQTASNPVVSRLKQALFAHPLVQSLSKSSNDAPSYISAQTFASALVDVLDNQGNAIAMMLLRLAATNPAEFKARIAGLDASVATNPSRVLTRLAEQLNADVKAATTDAGADLDVGKLARASLAWPDASDLIAQSMDRPVVRDRWSELAVMLKAIPLSWQNDDLRPIYIQFKESFPMENPPVDLADASRIKHLTDAELQTKLDVFVQAVSDWETITCQIARGVKNTLDGIRCIIDTLPDDLGTLRRALRTVFDRLGPTTLAGAADVEKFYAGVENWYCEVTQRAAGWYKRNARIWGLICSLILCIAVNADVIFVVRALSSDPTLRASVAAAAIKAAADYDASRKEAEAKATHPAPAAGAAAAASATSRADAASAASKADTAKTGKPATQTEMLTAVNIIPARCVEVFGKVDHNEQMSGDDVKDVLRCQSQIAEAGLKYLENSALPIGWSPARQNLIFGGYYQGAASEGEWLRWWRVISSGAFWLWISGVLISTLAVTLGGEYWFSLLEQVVRLSGGKPDKPDPAGKT